jgi:hypothetical protein
MVEEFNALLKNGTWTLVPHKPSMNIVGSKWVFRIKRKADGSGTLQGMPSCQRFPPTTGG